LSLKPKRGRVKSFLSYVNQTKQRFSFHFDKSLPHAEQGKLFFPEFYRNLCILNYDIIPK